MEEGLEGLESLARDIVSRKSGKIIAVNREVSGEPEPGPSVADAGLPQDVVEALARRGIDRLYRFQWEALQKIREGKDVVIVAGTGTGKTEAFLLPVIAKEGSALLLYPTKALARDQAKRLSQILGYTRARYAVLDGDTAPAERRSIYEDPPNIIISNPDFVHMALAMSREFRELMSRIDAVVLDEMHVYQGVFGSHVKWIIYRLLQEAGDLQLIGSGATIGNPEDIGPKLFNKPYVEVVRGPPRRRGQALHAFVSYGNLSRWSFAAYLIASLVKSGLKVLGFTDSQQMTELVARIAKKEYGVDVGVHRAGLPAEHRRSVERRFSEGSLSAVVATSTLELGIDIGDLDAVVMASLPKSYTSYVQRAGRAGRRGRPGLVLTLMGDDPIEAYYSSRPSEFFGRAPDPAYIEPSNPEVAAVHLAAMLLQRGAIRVSTLPDEFKSVVERLVREGLARRRSDALLVNYRAAANYVQSRSLRSAGPMVKIVSGAKVIGEREMPMALYDLHPGAVYYHAGRPYISTLLDLNSMRAQVSELPQSVSFYTKPLYNIDILEVDIEDERSYGPVAAAYGRVHVKVSTTGYVVKDEFSGTTISEVTYDVPISWDYWTKGVLLRYPLMDFDTVEESLSAYHALEHVLISAARPVVGASDTDLSGVSYPTGHIVIYDSHVGGNGASRLAYERLLRVQEIAKSIVSSCTCQDGCPRCVYSPYCGNNNRFLSRHGALRVLEGLRGAEKPKALDIDAIKGESTKAA